MKRGFTLIELLVVSGIVIFLSGIIFINYRSIGEEFLLQRSAHKLAQDIRRAGELAMSAKEFQAQVPQGGYGINLKISENTSYILYADINGSEYYDTPDGLIETVPFEKGVFIKSLSKDNLSINFKPPSPTVRLDGLTSAEITLSLESDPNRIKTIKVNSAGLIEVE